MFVVRNLASHVTPREAIFQYCINKLCLSTNSCWQTYSTMLDNKYAMIQAWCVLNTGWPTGTGRLKIASMHSTAVVEWEWAVADLETSIYNAILVAKAVEYRVFWNNAYGKSGISKKSSWCTAGFRVHFKLGCHDTLPSRNTILKWVHSLRATGSIVKKKSLSPSKTARTLQRSRWLGNRWFGALARRHDR